MWLTSDRTAEVLDHDRHAGERTGGSCRLGTSGRVARVDDGVDRRIGGLGGPDRRLDQVAGSDLTASNEGRLGHGTESSDLGVRDWVR